jgi:hypothetical protein
MTHLSDDDIPHVWHRFNKVRRTPALQDFMDTPQWHQFAHREAYNDFMHAYGARISESSAKECFNK